MLYLRSFLNHFKPVHRSFQNSGIHFFSLLLAPKYLDLAFFPFLFFPTQCQASLETSEGERSERGTLGSSPETACYALLRGL